MTTETRRTENCRKAMVVSMFSTATRITPTLGGIIPSGRMGSPGSGSPRVQTQRTARAEYSKGTNTLPGDFSPFPLRRSVTPRQSGRPSEGSLSVVVSIRHGQHAVRPVRCLEPDSQTKKNIYHRSSLFGSTHLQRDDSRCCTYIFLFRPSSPKHSPTSCALVGRATSRSAAVIQLYTIIWEYFGSSLSSSICTKNTARSRSNRPRNVPR